MSHDEQAITEMKASSARTLAELAQSLGGTEEVKRAISIAYRLGSCDGAYEALAKLVPA